ncbi:MAG: hypothetical protein WKF90_11005 [Pyrinomonadaceae bacterium]
MYLKTKDFYTDSDTATAARISNRLDNLYDDLNRCKDSHCKASHRIRQENFLIKEADKILLDSNATRSAKAFAAIVYEILTAFEDIGKDNDE